MNSVRFSAAALLVVIALAACGGPDESTEPQHSVSNPPPGGCCRVCTTGQACGDACISASNTCHTAPGCACNG
jgi:hypothetical protein